MIADRRRFATMLGVMALAASACAPEPSTAPLDGAARLASGNPGGGGSGNGGGGGGGGDEGFGNNLSWPVIFADGRGLGGASISGPGDFGNTGLRPLATDSAAAAARAGAPVGPFWYAGNASETYLTFKVFWQKSVNVWQAAWQSRQGTPTPVIVDWGDNLRSVKYASTSVIRVEHVLNASDGTTLNGFPMDITLNPSSQNEAQGIYDDGMQSQTIAFTPTVFTPKARLTIQKLTDKGGAVTYTYLNALVEDGYGIDGPDGYAGEINVGGKVVYGYVWNLKNVVMPGGIAKDGWWRITFSVDSPTSVSFSGIGAGDEVMASFTPTSTVSEIQITTSRGGGGGKKP
jgi:hypothetical protein